MRNEKGFALLVLVSLLPLVIAGVAALYVLIGFIEDRSLAKNGCRRELLAGLDDASRTLDALFALNPLALELRAEMTAAVAELAAALPTGSPPLIAKAKARILAVRRRQALLDRDQKALIRTMRAVLLLALRRAGDAAEASVFSFVQKRSASSRAVRVAVRPDLPGPAPVYVLEEDFERRQALVHRWQGHFSLRGPLGSFLRAQGKFEEVCAATLTQEKTKWLPRLIEDKFSSRLSSF